MDPEVVYQVLLARFPEFAAAVINEAALRSGMVPQPPAPHGAPQPPVPQLPPHALHHPASAGIKPAALAYAARNFQLGPEAFGADNTAVVVVSPDEEDLGAACPVYEPIVSLWFAQNHPNCIGATLEHLPGTPTRIRVHRLVDR